MKNFVRFGISVITLAKGRRIIYLQTICGLLITFLKRHNVMGRIPINLLITSVN